MGNAPSWFGATEPSAKRARPVVEPLAPPLGRALVTVKGPPRPPSAATGQVYRKLKRCEVEMLQTVVANFDGEAFFEKFNLKFEGIEAEGKRDCDIRLFVTEDPVKDRIPERAKAAVEDGKRPMVLFLTKDIPRAPRPGAAAAAAAVPPNYVEYLRGITWWYVRYVVDPEKGHAYVLHPDASNKKVVGNIILVLKSGEI